MSNNIINNNNNNNKVRFKVENIKILKRKEKKYSNYLIFSFIYLSINYFNNFIIIVVIIIIVISLKMKLICTN